ncbi:MAG: GDP-mannose 4,6-dehydratase, partial [Chlamydiota bacterium]
MKIFITGIAGFIGFHLAKVLKARGDVVIGCDNFNAYYDPELKKKRAQILLQDDIHVLNIDICHSSLIENVVSENGITHFVHLAAHAGVRHSL